MTKGQHIEWKSSWHDEHLKWICGFANAKGGVLVVGRDDKGRVSGLDDALREALLNAAIHRDYSTPAPIQIRVYSDRVRIWNPGQLPEGWTREKLLGAHSSEPYNPEIAHVFFRAGEIEAWGRGIQRVFEACREAGSPKPRIEFDGRDVWVEFPFSKAYMEQVALETDGISGGTTPETTPETTQERILALLLREPTLTRKELSEQVGISLEGVKYHFNILRKHGRIRHIGPTKRGYWEVKESLAFEDSYLPGIDSTLADDRTRGTTLKTTQETTLKTTDGQAWLDWLGKRLAERLGETEGRVLLLIRVDSRISTRVLAEKIGVSATAMDKTLAKLKNRGILRRIGPARGGYWEIIENG